MQVAIPIFPQLTALDAIGPYEVLQRVPEADLVFVGEHRGEVRTENGFLGLTADATYAEVPAPDVVVVPGGIGTRALLSGGPLLDWLRAVHPGTRWTTSVCTGALLLAAAGLLDGLPATTHWSATGLLAELGAVPVPERVVLNPAERVITAAGVSSGIDMALRLLELLVDETAARAAQVLIEYDPEPPFDSGHPSRADAAVMARVAEFQRLRR
ncbi:transcriptional regulator GlxA family with amidase domain [Crossiella equi]|uniref:Transcriptional regulator GlxA family with amidase domain n=1 Tax=Crossiella equi TaxID=130796 RepID=A0ABS5A3P8_9PSEU|nr:DJ-1/PfpI family protein [Crossiella equi]MBP2471194.1 transcriptional regulator GlxA family with amidase domain [Crossiella equi]